MTTIEPRITRAEIAPGHDGSAELVIHLRYPNGGHDSVTLAADAAERLLGLCDAEAIADLAGESWRPLMQVLECDVQPLPEQ